MMLKVPRHPKSHTYPELAFTIPLDPLLTHLGVLYMLPHYVTDALIITVCPLVMQG